MKTLKCTVAQIRTHPGNWPMSLSSKFCVVTSTSCCFEPRIPDDEKQAIYDPTLDVECALFVHDQL